MHCAYFSPLHVFRSNLFQDVTYSLWYKINFLLQSKLCLLNEKSTRGILNKAPSGTINKLSKLSPTPNKQIEEWASDSETRRRFRNFLPEWRLRPTHMLQELGGWSKGLVLPLTWISALTAALHPQHWSIPDRSSIIISEHGLALPPSFPPSRLLPDLISESPRGADSSPQTFTLRTPHSICCVALQTQTKYFINSSYITILHCFIHDVLRNTPSFPS